MEEHKEYSGAEFNALAAARSIQIVKLVNACGVHNDFTFHEGLNVDTVEFQSSGTCSRGGIYFCEKKHVNHYISYSNRMMVYYYDVSIPDDARVYVEPKKFKADKIVLSGRKLLVELPELNLNEYLKIVNHAGEFDEIHDDPLFWAWVERAGVAPKLKILSPSERTPEAALRIIRDKQATKLTYLKKDAFTDEVIDALMGVWFDFRLLSFPSSNWSSKIWVHQVQLGYITDLKSIPEAAMSEELKNLLVSMGLLDLDQFVALPEYMQTRAMWENAVVNTDLLKNISPKFNIPDRFRDEQMLALLQSKGYAKETDIDFLRDELQTHDMWANLVRSRKLKSSSCIPSRFMDADMNVLLVCNNYKRLYELNYAERKVAFSQTLFDALVKKGMFAEIRLFPPEYFNQQVYNVLFEKGFPVRDIPQEFHTSAMYLSRVRNHSIIDHRSVPTHLLTPEIWEELVQVNINNLRDVPPQMLSERMIATAVERRQTHLLPQDRRPRPEKVIVKRRKTKDWARR